MATLPATGYLSNAARTEAEMQTAFEAVRDVLSQIPASAEVQLTIASGSVTPATRDQGSVKIETEAAAASDDLANIAQTNTPDGTLLLLRASVAGHTVVLKHAAGGAGQMLLQYDADFSLNATDKWVILKRVGTSWEEVFRSNGNDPTQSRSDLGIIRLCTAAAGGSADAITASHSPAFTAHTQNAIFAVECGSANATATPTFNPDGVGAKTIVKGSNEALAAGDIPGGNFLALLRYDSSLDKYQLLNPYAPASIAQNSQSTGYTLVLTDANKHLLHPSADTTARTFTIPANSSVAYPIGTAITFVNQNGAGVLTISITTDTMRLAGGGTTGSRTLAANGIATALKVTSTEWIISGTGLS